LRTSQSPSSAPPTEHIATVRPYRSTEIGRQATGWLANEGVQVVRRPGAAPSLQAVPAAAKLAAFRRIDSHKANALHEFTACRHRSRRQAAPPRLAAAAVAVDPLIASTTAVEQQVFSGQTWNAVLLRWARRRLDSSRSHEGSDTPQNINCRAGRHRGGRLQGLRPSHGRSTY
jgi:hypothetical protein